MEGEALDVDERTRDLQPMTATRMHADATVLVLDANAGSRIGRLLALVSEAVADGGDRLRDREQSLQFIRLDQEGHCIGPTLQTEGASSFVRPSRVVLIYRLRAAPRRREIARPQCALQCRSGGHRRGCLNLPRPAPCRSELLAEKRVKYLSACLRALAERDDGLRADDACCRLPLAGMLNVGHDIFGCQQGFGCIDLGLRYGLRPDVWQQDQNDAQPKCHSQEEPHSLGLSFSERSCLSAFSG